MAEIPADVKSAAEDPQRRLGRYVLVKKLGKGGQGEVWRAWDTRLARAVAVKILRDPDPEDLTRFQREANILANLHHSNIAPVFALEQDGGRHFIAMELIDGETIDVLNAPLARKLEHLRDAARALDFAHGKGIVHRDVKPSNLMVTPSGRIFLLDFGVARPARRGATITATDFIVGTPAYMAPEQARGGRVDARTDVYSLGATLYRLATHSDPFYGDDPMQVLLKVSQEAPPRPRTLEPSIPRGVEDIIRVAMSKEPESRHASAAEFAEELDRFLAGKKVRAAPRDPIRVPQGLVMVLLAAVALASVAWAVFRPGPDPAPVVDRTDGARDELAAWRVLQETGPWFEKLFKNPSLSPAEREAHAAAIREIVGRALALRADFGPAHLDSARLAWVMGDLEGADAAATRAVAADPGNPSAWLMRSRTRARRALVARTRRLAALDPGGVDAASLQRLLSDATTDPPELRALFEGTVSDLARFKALASAAQPAEAAFGEGLAAFNVGRYADAARFFLRATEAPSLEREARLMHALSAAVQGDTQGGEAAFGALAAGADVHEARILLAMVQILESVRRFPAGTEPRPVSIGIAFNLRTLRAALGDLAEWDRVVPLSPFWKRAFGSYLDRR